MIINDLLNKDNNNLDLIRIILASLVILGHTIAINGDSRYWLDPIAYFFSITYSGALAVKIFFFISGLVVTNSYLKNDNLIYFIFSRAFRVLPALLFLLLVTVFIIGPIFTNFSLLEYFSDSNTFNYISKNMIFNTQFTLPGLFTDNLYKGSINGSLWSLLYEIKCYFFLLFSFLLIKKKRTLFLNIIFSVIFLDCFLATSTIFDQFTRNNPEVFYLPFSFAYGAFLAINGSKLKINLEIVVISLFIYFIFKNTSHNELLLIIVFCNFTIYIASRKFILKLKPKFDISYGIYLWGFLVQQIVYFVFGHIYTGMHFTIALTISIIIAYISFVYIEKPFVIFGKKASAFCMLKYDTFLEKKSNIKIINN
jgi:peptidoglycan/LPS O-acetylase OafA/YrhL